MYKNIRDLALKVLSLAKEARADYLINEIVSMDYLCVEINEEIIDLMRASITQGRCISDFLAIRKAVIAAHNYNLSRIESSTISWPNGPAMVYAMLTN